MKYIYSVCLILFSIGFLSAQSIKTKNADKHFDRFEYAKASEAYLELAEKDPDDPYLVKQLAQSYYHLQDYKAAAKWYAKAVATTQDAEMHYRYAQMLKASGKYKEADRELQQFALLAPNDSRAKAYVKEPNYLQKIQSIESSFSIQSLSINSEKADFGAFMHNDVLYFSSAMNSPKKPKSGNSPYLDIYQSQVSNSSDFSKPEPVSDLNSKFHDGTACISADGNTVYFSSESFNEKEFEKVKEVNAKFGQLYLYKAFKSGSGWNNVTLLPFNNVEFSSANPSISSDGKTLYFSSNRPGGMGGIDIWKVAINNDGSFDTPVNLGAKVNSEGDENFPFISEDNQTLYFASNGKLGLGGYDIFSIKTSLEAEAINPGKPLNSGQDDFAFTFNTTKNVGFFATNRSGNDDIYKAVPKCQAQIAVVVTNSKTGGLLDNAGVAIVNSNKKVVFSGLTDSKGLINYGAECDQKLVVQAEKEGYTAKTVTIDESGKKTIAVSLALDPIEIEVEKKEIELADVYFEYDKSTITEQTGIVLDQLIALMKEQSTLTIFVKAHTDNRGSADYNQRLSEARAQSTVQYIISKGINRNRISGRGYGETEPKVNCLEDCTEAEHTINRRSQFIIVKQ